ncbi:MAG TPA: zinc-binding dehydrogenase [Bryobacteraceae bacterium]
MQLEVPDPADSDAHILHDPQVADALGQLLGTQRVGGTGRSTDPRIRESFFIVEPNQKQLFEIADMLDAGRLRTVVDSVVPFSQAVEVYEGMAPRQHRGKVVVSVSGNQ